MRKEQLAELNHENLFGLMRNPSVSDEIQLHAAVILYERGSRFVQTPEFLKLKPRVLDHILKNYAERPPSFNANTPLDALGRLHEHFELLGKSHSEVADRHHERMAQLAEAVATYVAAQNQVNQHHENRVMKLAAATAEGDLNQAINTARHRNEVEGALAEHVATFRKFARQVKIVLYVVGAAIPVVTAIGMYLAIHYLK